MNHIYEFKKYYEKNLDIDNYVSHTRAKYQSLWEQQRMLTAVAMPTTIVGVALQHLWQKRSRRHQDTVAVEKAMPTTTVDGRRS
jgi:hypothetical protein